MEATGGLSFAKYQVGIQQCRQQERYFIQIWDCQSRHEVRSVSISASDLEEVYSSQ